MKIRILAVGRTKHPWCLAGEEDYLTRLKYFCEVEKSEVPEEKITVSVSADDVKKKEGEKLLARVPEGFITVALSPSGRSFTSEAFASFLGECRDFKGGKICFLIGGPKGLSSLVEKSAHTTLSFSPMTFPHDLFRVILLEQIYRAFTLLEGRKYHC